MTEVSGDGDGPGTGADEATPLTGVPRWLKVFGIVAVLVAVLVVVLLLVVGGDHGPGRHMRADGGFGEARADRDPPAGAHA